MKFIFHYLEIIGVPFAYISLIKFHKITYFKYIIKYFSSVIKIVKITNNNILDPRSTWWFFRRHRIEQQFSGLNFDQIFCRDPEQLGNNRLESPSKSWSV